MKQTAPTYSYTFLILALFLFACNTTPSEEEYEAMSKQQTTVESSLVHTIVLQKQSFIKQILSNGKLTAKRKALLVAEQNGLIEQLLVHNGQRVKQGATIAKLNTKKIDRVVHNAEIDFQKAKLSRTELLLAQGFDTNLNDSIPTEAERIANIRSGYSLAKSQLAEAHERLAMHTIKAPFTGTIANLTHKKHNQITAGSSLCSLIDNTNFELQFQILESDLPQVKIGQNVQIRAYATNTELQGQLTEINPVVEANGMIQVKASVRNNGKLLEGMNVSVVAEQIFHEQLVVPKSAVLIRQNKEVLFIVKKGKAYWTYVHSLHSNTTHHAVIANTDRSATLAAGDTVIVDGNINLAHESSVSLTK